MEDSKDVRKHMHEYNMIILDLKSVNVRIKEEDQGVIYFLAHYQNL